MSPVRLAAFALAVTLGLAGCGAGRTADPRAHPVKPPAGGTTRHTDGCRPRSGSWGHQLRGLWISTFGNTDWPSRPGLSAATQRRQFVHLLDAARRAHLNAVFVQVRPRADAIYRSRYEPWSQALTGTPGRSPGYDPLAFAIRATHARNMELHAWFNPFQITTQGDKPLPKNDPARRHPNWVRHYAGRLYYDPGIPAVRRFTERVILDVTRRYDIDGVHLDDHFYPYPVPGQTFRDGATYKRYGHGFAHRDDWRRHNVDLLVRELHRRIHRTKRWVRFGISPFGIWRNAASDPAGSATHGLESYNSVYADSRTWVKHGWVDYIAPQIYWSSHDKAAPYDTLVRWWSRQVAGTDVRLYIGQAAYRMDKHSDDPAFRDGREMNRHLRQNKRYPRVGGDIYFSARDLAADRDGFARRLASGPYREPACP